MCDGLWYVCGTCVMGSGMCVVLRHRPTNLHSYVSASVRVTFKSCSSALTHMRVCVHCECHLLTGQNDLRSRSELGSSDIKPIPKFKVIVSIWVIITYSPHVHRCTFTFCQSAKVRLRPASAKVVSS